MEEVRAIEQTATQHWGPLVRVTLRSELRKVFAVPRNDDSAWGKPDAGTFAGDYPRGGFLYGIAEKTKAT